MIANRKLESNAVIRVALTEAHGMADEESQHPPAGVTYSFIEASSPSYRFIRSPVKGYLRHFTASDHDLIEAVLSPILTENKWIYSIANLQEAAAFSFLGIPLPRSIRIAYIKSLLLKDNLKKVVFWSNAGRSTLASYGKINDKRFLNKTTVVYPAIRQVSDDLIKFNDSEDVQILFSGDFFRKGGVNLIDAFERAQKLYPKIKLMLCCDENIDFNTRNIALKNEYLSKIRRNAGITFGRVTREHLTNRVLPRTDIYALPTYVEAFGFALLEAMAFGIPVITTNYFAIPEIVEHGVSGFLIDTEQYNCERMFRGYVVNEIPYGFREYLTERIYKHLCSLIKSVYLREKLGMAGVRIARTKFSVEARNMRMLNIYRQALGYAECVKGFETVG